MQALREAPLFGISADEVKINFRRVHDHVNAVIAALSPAYAAPRKNWRVKRGAVPQWYKQRAGVRRHVQSAAARVARFRPPGARR